jgi:transposase InsO family protein
MQNAFIERFNRSYLEAVLDMFVFQSLSEVREQKELWLNRYNEERPHKSLGHLTPGNKPKTGNWPSRQQRAGHRLHYRTWLMYT